MIETHVDRARETVEAERDVLAEERAAYEQFRRRVADVSTAEGRPTVSASASLGGVATRTSSGDAGDTACATVREAFAETVRPHSVDDVGDEPLLETIREELGDGVALALAPTTGPGFTPQTKEAVLSATCERRHAIDATIDALDDEAESLQEVCKAVGEITEWLDAAEETPLPALGFDALRERHEQLSSYRERCATLLDDRQALLQQTTGRNPGADVGHRCLVRYLYQSFPVVYPVLSTLTRLYELLEECQRTVRDHLTQRG